MIKKKQAQRMNKVQFPKVGWVEIDPKKAQEMLDRLTSQRRLVPHHVAFLAGEMRSGNWKINGDTIRFSRKRLLDGQHRLHAVIQANFTLVALVVEEIEDDAFDTIDVGRTRAAGDVMSTLGVSQPFATAAIARFIWYYDNSISLDSSLRVPIHELINTVKRNSAIPIIVDYLASKKTMRASPIGAALVLISRKAGLENAMFFADKLVNGVDLKADDAIRFYRDKWLTTGYHRSSRGDRVTWMATCIKTYNSWIQKKKVERPERWSAGEAFPEAIMPEKK